MINALDLPLNEVTYTFVDSKTGEATHIAVTTLTAVLKRAGVIPEMVMMGEGLIAAMTRGDLNVEEDHALKLPDAALDVPIIVGHWGDEHIIIDGSHRLWRRWQRGDLDFPAYMVPETAWRHFVIGGLPDDGKFWEYFNRNAKIR